MENNGIENFVSHFDAVVFLSNFRNSKLKFAKKEGHDARYEYGLQSLKNVVYYPKLPQKLHLRSVFYSKKVMVRKCLWIVTFKK